MKTCNINGIELAYLRRGRGIPFVLLHGYPLDHSIWEGLMPLLEDQFDLIVPDLRGFGASSKIETIYSISDMAEDLADMLDQFGLATCHMAGHSMGGYVALEFARKMDDRLSGLALVSSQVAGDTEERRAARIRTAAEVADRGIGAFVQTMAAGLTSDGNLQGSLRGVISRQDKAGVIGALRAMAGRGSYENVLPKLMVPVAVIHGAEDQLIPIQRAQEAAAQNPRARLFELQGVGHMPMLEAPDQTAQALKSLNG